MNLWKSLLAGVTLLLLTGAAGAGPVQSNASDTKDRPITRGELVRDVDHILTRWEQDSRQYATKAEVNELRAVLMEMRRELDSTSARTRSLEDSVDQLDQRADHTSRPGF